MPSQDFEFEPLLRELAPQVLGAVVRRFRDFDASEDAVQEALLAAANQWPRGGLPANPRGWLIQVAARRLIDLLRSDASRRAREAALAEETAFVVVPAAYGETERHLSSAADLGADFESEADGTLVLLFLCCHPALPSSAAVALTLRAVGGLTTGEIARAFLLPEATMGQRIHRAKQAIKKSGVPFRLPDAAERAERLASVLHVLYLIFNEGYAATSGPELARTDLSNEAIRLARIVHRMLPDDAEAAGLLALMLLTDARRAARTGPAGELIPLDEQDRSLWDAARIEEGVALVSAALRRGAVGPYQLQAAVAAVHDEAPSADATDWPQILALYTVLLRLEDNPIVALNQAVAFAMVHGAEAGLERLRPLETDERLAGGHRLDAVRAHLLERAGRTEEAGALYCAAAEKTTSVPEREYLLRRAGRLPT